MNAGQVSQKLRWKTFSVKTRRDNKRRIGVVGNEPETISVLGLPLRDSGGYCERSQRCPFAVYARRRLTGPDIVNGGNGATDALADRSVGLALPPAKD